jgi:hypothetical protein
MNHAEVLRLFRATVTDITNGLVSIQRGDASEEDAGYPLLVPGVPSVADDVVGVMVGGAPLILGRVGLSDPDTIDLGVPAIGQTYTSGDSASAATTATNTSTTTYVTARAYTWSTLPDGTYDLVVDWSAQFSDSASGSINVQLIAGVTNDAVFTLSLTTNREVLRFVRRFSAVAVTGGITFTIQYKRDAGSGTASARNPAIMIHATRVS